MSIGSWAVQATVCVYVYVFCQGCIPPAKHPNVFKFTNSGNEWNHTISVYTCVNIGYWKSRMIDYFSEFNLIFILYSIFLSCV